MFPGRHTDEADLLARMIPEFRDRRAALSVATTDANAVLSSALVKASDLYLTEIRLPDLDVTPSADDLAHTLFPTGELR